jgi:hypothetical protein
MNKSSFKKVHLYYTKPVSFLLTPLVGFDLKVVFACWFPALFCGGKLANLRIKRLEGPINNGGFP